MLDGFPYFVNGLGGAGIRTFGAPVAGSQVRYNGDYGALLIEADDAQMRFQFINRSGTLIDNFTLEHAAEPTQTPTPQATVVLQPLADAFVDASAPTTNYGTEALLEIDGSPQKIAYLRFDLSGLTGATLRSAQLRMRVADSNDAQSTSTQEIRLTNGADWDEASIVFDGRPALAKTSLGVFSGDAQGEWISASLSVALQSFFGEWATLTLDSTGSDGLDVSSREGSDPPQLVLAYDHPPAISTPTPTATSTPTVTPTSTHPPEATPANVYLPKVNR